MHNKPNRPKPAQPSDICARAIEWYTRTTLTFLCYGETSKEKERTLLD